MLVLVGHWGLSMSDIPSGVTKPDISPLCSLVKIITQRGNTQTKGTGLNLGLGSWYGFKRRLTEHRISIVVCLHTPTMIGMILVKIDSAFIP